MVVDGSSISTANTMTAMGQCLFLLDSLHYRGPWLSLFSLAQRCTGARCVPRRCPQELKYQMIWWKTMKALQGSTHRSPCAHIPRSVFLADKPLLPWTWDKNKSRCWLLSLVLQWKLLDAGLMISEIITALPGMTLSACQSEKPLR